MKYRPSALEEYISNLPVYLQGIALEAVKREHDRFKRCDFTEEEKKLFICAKGMGRSAANVRWKIAMDVFKERKNQE